MTEYDNSDELGTERQEENEVSWEELFEIQTQTIKELINRVEALESTAPAQGSAPTIYCWRELTDPKAREELWATLRDWVDWISYRYLSESYIRIPACWYRHPVAVEELTALWAAWYAAYHQDDSPNMLAIDWHQRFFWPTLEHLKDHVYRECFRTEEHRPNHAADLHLTDAGFEEFASYDATWAQNPLIS